MNGLFGHIYGVTMLSLFYLTVSGIAKPNLTYIGQF